MGCDLEGQMLVAAAIGAAAYIVLVWIVATILGRRK